MPRTPPHVVSALDGHEKRVLVLVNQVELYVIKVEVPCQHLQQDRRTEHTHHNIMAPQQKTKGSLLNFALSER